MRRAELHQERLTPGRLQFSSASRKPLDAGPHCWRTTSNRLVSFVTPAASSVLIVDVKHERYALSISRRTSDAGAAGGPVEREHAINRNEMAMMPNLTAPILWPPSIGAKDRSNLTLVESAWPRRPGIPENRKKRVNRVKGEPRRVSFATSFELVS